MLNPLTNTVWYSAPISTTTSYWGVIQAMNPYYANYLSAGVNVVKINYDVSGNPTTNPANVVQSVFTLSCSKSITGVSTNQITIKKVTTKSVIVALPPSKVQTSSPPMTGAFKINCIMPDGTSNVTVDIPL